MEATRGCNIDLISISRSPIHCPVAACNQMVGVTSVLTHFLRDHNQSLDGDFREIAANHPVLLVFNEQFFKMDKTSCLGVLAYAGSSEGSVPAINGLSRANSFLPEKFSRFSNHLPILILGCKTHLSSMFTDKDVTKRLKSQYGVPNDPADDLLIIWLATMDITRPLHCTITAFHPNFTISRSTMVMVRNLKSSQNPAEFIPDDMDCLVLNRGELDVLVENEELADIQLEILVHELKLVD